MILKVHQQKVDWDDMLGILTETRREVIELHRQGYSDAEISERIGFSTYKVTEHRREATAELYASERYGKAI